MAAPPDQETRGIPLTDTQRAAWLRLFRSENVGPITFRELVTHFGSAAAALDALPALAAKGGRRIRIAPADEIAREIEATARLGARFVAMGEPDYPRWLRHADGAPPIIAVQGSGDTLTRPMVAIVGARNASVAGRKMAMLLAAGLGRAGFVVVSGLARGIDAAAHEAALTTGTIAVLAGGLDRIYPPENEPLVARIVETGGLAITEMPLSWEPRARDFPRRNRIVSGLSIGVVVVEAADRSGSLITARLAGEQGRLLFAVPGSPLDPRAAGTNRLIKNGAVLVTEAEDVVEQIRPLIDLPPSLVPGGSIAEEREPMPMQEAGDEDRRRIVEALGPVPTEIDAIIRMTGLHPAKVHMVLLELDLAGRIERHGSQLVSLT